jgi:hypothetical protein
MSYKVLVLRNCRKDGTSYTGKRRDGTVNGWVWPMTVGSVVECPDWVDDYKCGGKFHGLLWGIGDYSLLFDDLEAVWQVYEVLNDDLRHGEGSLIDKCGWRKGTLVYSGSMASAMTLCLCCEEAIKDAGVASSGDYSTAASSGYSSRAASSGNSSTAASSGNSSTAASSGYSSTAASSGYSSRAASSGNSSRAASSGNSSRAASSGNSSTAASSGNSSTAASSGDDTVSMAAGVGCVVQAGNGGCFASVWFDGTRNRIVAGYVGEDGIKADTMYRLNKGNWQEVKS